MSVTPISNANLDDGGFRRWLADALGLVLSYSKTGKHFVLTAGDRPPVYPSIVIVRGLVGLYLRGPEPPQPRPGRIKRIEQILDAIAPERTDVRRRNPYS